LPKNTFPGAATVIVEITRQVCGALGEHHALAMELLGYEYE
jgi:hypothetical protein